MNGGASVSSSQPRERAETSASQDTRTRLLQATLTCFEKRGIAKTSLEDIAAEAGFSRATVYRYFPGGRDQLVSETVTWEVSNYLQRLTDSVADEQGLAAKLERALIVGHRLLDEHQLLHQVLSTEPEAVLAELAECQPLVFELVYGYLGRQLGAERLRPEVVHTEAAEYLARLFLSYLGSQGRWDLTDPVEVERLVRTQFLGGLVETGADSS